MSIKNIIFDLGGVLIDIDYHLTSKAFRRIGAPNFDQIYSQHKQSDLFDAFETGKIPVDHFRITLQTQLGIQVSHTVFDAAWNAMILPFPDQITDFLINIRQHYRIFLFSNTNAIHLKAVDQIAKNQNMDHFNQLFDATYYSHLFGHRKPHPESFLKILQEQQLLPEETLFIDDTNQHIEGAQKAELQTFYIPKNSNILEFKLPLLEKIRDIV